MECYHRGKHAGEVRRRRVLTFAGEYTTRRHSVAVCDKHHQQELRNIIKRGKAAEKILAGLR
jgi:hypothetical protein